MKHCAAQTESAAGEAVLTLSFLPALRGTDTIYVCKFQLWILFYGFVFVCLPKFGLYIESA